MTALRASIALVTAVAISTLAYSGHELPVYPSYYPHEIEIRTVAPDEAAALLRESKIQAYVGALRSPAALPDSISAVETLGSFVVVRVNPASPRAPDDACTIIRGILRHLAGKSGDLIVHPYPVTPLHGDYLYHADLADAAKARLLGDAAAPPIEGLKVKASGALARTLIRPDWATDGFWDAEIVEIDAATLVGSAMLATNGWGGPPWVRTGWFHAHLILADGDREPASNDRTKADLRRLQTGAYDDTVERINLERDLVSELTAGCRKIVAGYTVKPHYFSSEFSAGIENIGFDAIEGFNAPIFIRTVKLKDFPWNGWLALGIDGRPAAAWNPIAGFTDNFGRLVRSAAGDPAVIPSPYESVWMLNRISDVAAVPGR